MMWHRRKRRVAEMDEQRVEQRNRIDAAERALQVQSQQVESEVQRHRGIPDSLRDRINALDLVRGEVDFVAAEFERMIREERR